MVGHSEVCLQCKILGFWLSPDNFQAWQVSVGFKRSTRRITGCVAAPAVCSLAIALPGMVSSLGAQALGLVVLVWPRAELSGRTTAADISTSCETAHIISPLAVATPPC